MYNSTCFGRPHARHQELNNCSNGLWFLPAGPTTNNSTATTRLRR